MVLYEKDTWGLIPALDEDVFGTAVEAPAIINLDASAAAIAKAVAPRKLFTLLVPPSFK